MAVREKWRCPAVFSQCLLRSAPWGALGRAVLVAQAGAAPVQAKLLPVGFPLAHGALLVRRRDAQSGSLAPAAQAGLRGDEQGETEVTRVDYGVKEEEMWESSQ